MVGHNHNLTSKNLTDSEAEERTVGPPLCPPGDPGCAGIEKRIVSPPSVLEERIRSPPFCGPGIKCPSVVD